jgi:hypothetical protein
VAGGTGDRPPPHDRQRISLGTRGEHPEGRPFQCSDLLRREWKDALAARLAGIPIRVGQKKGLPALLYNQHPADSGTASTATEAHLQVARCVGAETNVAT